LGGLASSYRQLSKPARTGKPRLEESKMRIYLSQIVFALAVIALLGAGSVFAFSPAQAPESPADLSGRASTLLAEVQDEAVRLRLHAEKLGTLADNFQYSWQSHAFYLDRVKGHINAVGERTAELQQIRHAVLPWQQQAITEVSSHAAQVAASTQAAILYLNKNQRWLFAPEYRDHLTTIADRSEDMEQTLDKFVDYENAQQKFQQLQKDLELAGD